MSDAPTADSLATSLVCGCEGFRSAPYLDSAGIWTIGYGTIRINGQPVTANTPPIDEPTARTLMESELQPVVKSVRGLLCPGTGPWSVTEAQIAACASFSYNEGLGAFRGSTILYLIHQGDDAGAAEHFMDWIYDHDPVTHQLVEVEGLRNRRLKEQAVFLGAAP
jgi:lysozyme